MGVMDERGLLETVSLDRTVNVQVDAKRVFRESVKDVDDAAAIMLGPAQVALEALKEQFHGDNGVEAAKAVLSSYTKLQEIRARLVGDHEKLLVEMQKDLNKCVIERKRIDALRPPVDPSSLSDAQLTALLTAAS